MGHLGLNVFSALTSAISRTANRRGRIPALYCFAAFAAGWSLQLVAIYVSGGNLDSPRARVWLAATMAQPALVTLILAWLIPSVRSAIRWRPRWGAAPTLLVAVVVPSIVAFTIVGICVLARWGQPAWFAFGPKAVSVSGGPWLLGLGVQSWPIFVTNVFVTGFAYSVFSGIFAVGEELGWRGLLQGLLIERFGMVRGVSLLGLLWSFWHLPLLLSGYNYPDHRVLGAFVLFPVTLMTASYFLAWLSLRFDSFWPAALAHGATNSIQQGVIGNIQLHVPHLVVDFLQTGITAAVGFIFLALLTAFHNTNER